MVQQDDLEIRRRINRGRHWESEMKRACSVHIGRSIPFSLPDRRRDYGRFPIDRPWKVDRSTKCFPPREISATREGSRNDHQRIINESFHCDIAFQHFLFPFCYRSVLGWTSSFLLRGDCYYFLDRLMSHRSLYHHYVDITTNASQLCYRRIFCAARGAAINNKRLGQQG